MGERLASMDVSRGASWLLFSRRRNATPDVEDALRVSRRPSCSSLWAASSPHGRLLWGTPALTAGVLRGTRALTAGWAAQDSLSVGTDGCGLPQDLLGKARSSC